MASADRSLGQQNSRSALQCSQRQIFQTNRILIMSRLPNWNRAASKQPVSEAPVGCLPHRKGGRKHFHSCTDLEGAALPGPAQLACRFVQRAKASRPSVGWRHPLHFRLRVFQYFKWGHWNWNWWRYYFLSVATSWMDGLPSKKCSQLLASVCYVCADAEEFLFWKRPLGTAKAADGENFFGQKRSKPVLPAPTMEFRQDMCVCYLSKETKLHILTWL